MRYADDALVMCRSREQGEAALSQGPSWNRKGIVFLAPLAHEQGQRARPQLHPVPDRTAQAVATVLAFQSPNYLGLIDLTEPSSHPDPSGPGGKDRKPVVNDVGKPCENRMHGSGPETEPATDTEKNNPTGNRRQDNGALAYHHNMPLRHLGPTRW